MKQRTCSIDGCENVHKGHGYCKKHLVRWKKHGDPLYVYQNQQTKPCTVDGCPNLIHSKGLCRAHYDRKKRGSDMLAPIQPRHSSYQDRFLAYTEWNGDCLEWTGARLPKGYGITSKDNRNAYAHRIAWEMANGEIPEDMHIDHICSNPPCVNVEHLRLATPKQNMEHRARLSPRNTSGYRGVHWDSARHAWVATVSHFGKVIHLGRFSTREEANEVAVAARNELYTHNDEDRVA